MTTETAPRNINELLALNTYQGMTDEEIELIIEFRVRTKAYSYYTAYLAEEGIAAAERQQARLTEIGIQANDIFNRIIARHPYLNAGGEVNE